MVKSHGIGFKNAKRKEFGNKFEVREGRQASIDSLIQTLKHRVFKERNDHPCKELHGKQ